MVLGKSKASTLCFKSNENHKVGKFLQEMKLGFEWGQTPSNHMYARGECLHGLTCWTKPNGVGDANHQGINNLGGSSIGSYFCCRRCFYNKWATYHCNRVPKNALIFLWLLVQYIAKVRSHLITMYSSRSISFCLPKSLLKWISS